MDWELLRGTGELLGSAEGQWHIPRHWGALWGLLGATGDHWAATGGLLLWPGRHWWALVATGMHWGDAEVRWELLGGTGRP